MKYSILALLLIFCLNLKAQDHYAAASYEFIFSGAIVKDAGGFQYDSPIRFSGFYNGQRQYHFDFKGGRMGMYTGVGLENVGLITKPLPDLKIKHRAYGINVPLALKFGNMGARKYFAVGGMVDFFFNYKQKIFYADEKKKKSNKWFPDKQVNIVNPSVFVEAKFNYGIYVRARYFLLDFLKPSSFQVNETTFLPGYADESKLFLLSLGINIRNNSKGKSVDLQP